MQVKVPQQLLEYEDKIIGPLTLKQFVFVLVGLGSGVIIYLLLPPSFGFLAIIISIPVVSLFLAMAFIRFNNRPLDDYVLAAIGLITRPRFRVWAREEPKITEEAKLTTAITTKPVAKPDVKDLRTNLEILARVMDTHGRVSNGKGPELPIYEARLKERILHPITTEAELPPPLVEAEESLALAEDKATEVSRMLEEKKAQPTKRVEPNVGSLSVPPPQVLGGPRVAESKKGYREILEMARGFIKKENEEKNPPEGPPKGL